MSRSKLQSYIFSVELCYSVAISAAYKLFEIEETDQLVSRTLPASLFLSGTDDLSKTTICSSANSITCVELIAYLFLHYRVSCALALVFAQKVSDQPVSEKDACCCYKKNCIEESCVVNPREECS